MVATSLFFHRNVNSEAAEIYSGITSMLLALRENTVASIGWRFVGLGQEQTLKGLIRRTSRTQLRFSGGQDYIRRRRNRMNCRLYQSWQSSKQRISRFRTNWRNILGDFTAIERSPASVNSRRSDVPFSYNIFLNRTPGPTKHTVTRSQNRL